MPRTLSARCFQRVSASHSLLLIFTYTHAPPPSYGAYGSKKFPGYDPADVALLDRGFVLAVGHIRGGSELGAAWHAGGRQANKVRPRPRPRPRQPRGALSSVLSTGAALGCVPGRTTAMQQRCDV